MVPESVKALAEETDKATTYILNQFIWRYHPCCGLATTKAIFDKDRQKLRALVSATCKASLCINKEGNRGELVSKQDENRIASSMPIKSASFCSRILWMS